MAKGFNKEKFMSIIRPKIKKIDFHGEEIYLRELTAYEVVDLQKLIVNNVIQDDYYWKLLSMSCLDENNCSIMTVDEVKNMGNEKMVELTVEINEFNSLDLERTAKVKEFLAKNQQNASTQDSPTN